MSRLFAFIRQDLRAALIASLLVLGHALLLTAVKAPETARTEGLSHALGTTSALISITVLWVTFTILEALDARLFSCLPRRRRAASPQEGEEEGDEEEDDDGEVLVFSQTGVELGLGMLLLAVWTFYIPQAQIIMDAFLAGRSAGLTMIRGSYFTAMISLLLLQLHLLLSISWRAFRHGGVSSRAFWQGRTGWWVGTGSIKLADLEEESRGRGVEEKV